MLSKIDARLYNKISIQNVHNEIVEIIVQVNNYKKAKDELLNYSIGDIVRLPIINAVAFATNLSKIIKLSKEDCVNFISSTSNVCSLVYNSKKIINVGGLYDKIKSNISHSCVVIDTGIFPHIDFCLGKNRVIKFIDLIGQSKEMYDDNGHGTFVTGILCGNSIVSKFSGIDSSCNVIGIKALDKSGETSSVKILQAMQWVLDNKEKYNIKVVCMSFGSQITDSQDPLVYGAEVLWDNGIVVVSAAGNSGPESETIMSPGASRKIITVGSFEVDDNGYIRVSDFSSRGPAFGFYKPDMVVPGVNIISTNIFNITKEFYTSMTGTSVSAPIVAGIASLLLKINPNYSPNQIKYMLLKSCLKINGDRNSEGFGWLNLKGIKLL